MNRGKDEYIACKPWFTPISDMINESFAYMYTQGQHDKHTIYLDNIHGLP